MLSFYCLYVFILTRDVIIFPCNYSILCYDLCYHFFLSFFVIISPFFVFDENVTKSKKFSIQDGRQVFQLAFISYNQCLDRYSLAVYWLRPRTLKTVPRNLNEIAHSWIRLLCRFVLTFPAFSFGCAAKQIRRLVCTSIWVMALHHLFIYKQAKFFCESTFPPGFKDWRAGTTTLCRSQLYSTLYLTH